MGGIFRNEVSIYIAAANTNGSALTDAEKIVGEITNWSRSGGEQDTETVYTIGGDIEKEMPRAQIEVSFDIIVSNAAISTLDRYDTFWLGTTGASTGDPINKAIFIVGATNSLNKVWAFNNCKAVTWEPEMDAEDMIRGTITFKLNPLTTTGTANLKSSTLATSSTFFNW